MVPVRGTDWPSVNAQGDLFLAGTLCARHSMFYFFLILPLSKPIRVVLIFLIAALVRYNSHTIIFNLLKVYNSVIFSIFTGLCNHHHNPSSEHFHHFIKKSPAH